MAMWKKKVPGPTIGHEKDNIPIGGRDMPGHGYDPKKIVDASVNGLFGVKKFNPNHEPAGTPEGGQFASADSGSGTQEAKFRELKSKWAQINETLRPMMQNSDAPEVKQKLAQLKDIAKQIYAMEPHVTDSPYDPLPEGSKARDLVIVGGGPAGLSAAINAGAEGLSTVLVDANPTPGGQARFSSRIENYPGFPIGVTGQSLMNDMAEQASRFPATQLRSGVRATGLTVDPATGLKTVTFSDGTSETAKAVILAGGLEFRKLDFEGADSKNVITGDGATLSEVSKGKPVVIYGGANSAAQAALGCADASHVYLISRNPITKDMSDYQVEALRAQPNHITIIEGDEVKSFLPTKDGEYELSTKKGQHIEAAALGVFVGAAPKNDWLPPDIKIGTEGENRGKIVHDENYETGVPGVFAVGQTATGGIGRVLASAGSGQIAVANLFKYFSRVKKAEKPGQKQWNDLVDRMYQIDISDVPKFQDEPSEVNINLGSVLSNVKKSTVWIKKDPTAQGDNDSPGLSPGLVGTGYVWHKNPAQKPLVDKRKSPRLVVGAYGVKPNASFPNPGLTQIAKDVADTEPTDSPDNNGRPKWMASPGQGGKDPEYRSQKPGPNGNNDELFSQDINKNPPEFKPVDPDSYYLW